MGRDAQRAKLYGTVAENWGEEAAETVMAILPPWDSTEVALKSDIALVKSDITNLRVAVDARFDQVEAKIDAFRVGMDAKMDQQFARLLIWTIGIVLALASLILSAVAFV